MNAPKTIAVDPERLERFMQAAFGATGMNAADAAWCAGCLLKTNLWGIDSHGVFRLPIYLERLTNGAVKPNPAVRTERGFGALELLDGDDGMGFVVGREAMRRAIALARANGVGCVAAKRSNHFGAAALYARLAAEAGMIGLAMTNVGPLMVVPGGSRPIAGNNPIGFAAPGPGEFPFVMDISLSQVAGGKLLLAAKEGRRIPLDWAADRDGRPTDDPEKGYAGYLLPMGGHKGFALSLAVDILCGVMTGGAFLFGIGNMYKTRERPSGTGHFMLALDPAALLDRGEFDRRMAEFRQTVKASPMWDASQEMLIPGELEHRSEQVRRREGIPLPESLFAELNQAAAALGAALRLEPMPPR
jgi:LDH2 family malate/lactate/ureidoglycolate dehydrogenase